MFHPDSIKKNPFPPRISLTNFQVFNKTFELDTLISYKKKVTLPYKANIFSIHFSALEFTAPNKNHYAYKLDGFNENWIQIQNDNRVTFTNLDPGSYTFRVKGTNNDGLWSDEETRLDIEIIAPFWLKPQFRIIVMLMVGLFIYLYYKSRTKMYRKHNQELQKEIEERIHAENSLKESEKKYRDLIELSPDMIFVLSYDGKILFVNKATIKSMHAKTHLDLFHKNIAQFMENGKGEKIVTKIQKKIQNQAILKEDHVLISINNSHLNVELLGIPFDYNGEHAMQIFARDIHSRKEAERLVDISLKEKDVLLKEIHHRTKNNMAIIISLMQMQASNLNNPLIDEAFSVMSNRIRSMLLVHTQLYRSENFAHVNLKSYLEQLTIELRNAYSSHKNNVEFDIKMEEIELPVDKIIPFGMALNEIITNSLKYAFNSEKLGIIDIYASQVNHKIEMGIGDNGVGFEYEPSKLKSNSLGMTLIDILIKDQLEGEVIRLNENGLKYKLSFSLNSENT